MEKFGWFSISNKGHGRPDVTYLSYGPPFYAVLVQVSGIGE